MINTFVTIGTTSTEVLDLTGTEGATEIILGNESDADICLAIGGNVAILDSGIVLATGEKIVLDTRNTQFNKINAISLAGSKKLTVQANVTTPGDIINLINNSQYDILSLTWEYASNSTSYEISFDNGTTYTNIGNINTYNAILTPATTYNIIIRGVKGKFKGNGTTPITIIIP